MSNFRTAGGLQVKMLRGDRPAHLAQHRRRQTFGGYLMVKRLIFLLVTGLIFFQGCAMAGDIVGDVKQVRQGNKEANIDVSDIVKKYIPLSADRSAVEDFLKTQKFTLHNQPTSSDGSQTLVAIYSEKNLLKEPLINP